jgi:Fe-S cluster assembly iron-binding protein IscA
VSQPAADAIRAAAANAHLDLQSAVVHFLLESEANAVAHKFRVEKEPCADDIVFEDHGLRLAVAEDQLPVLSGTHVDMSTEGGEPPRFVVSNPNLQAQ